MTVIFECCVVSLIIAFVCQQWLYRWAHYTQRYWDWNRWAYSL